MVTQIAMYLAIPVDATGFQPELFNQTCQALIGLAALGFGLFKPGIVSAGMNIHKSAESENR